MSAQQTNLPIVAGSDLPIPGFVTTEDEHSTPGLSLTQIVTILRAHWKRSLTLLFALIFAFGVLIKILPGSYVATATLIVNRGNRNPLASPEFPTGWDNTFIPTQIDLIRSPAVLQPVINRLHLMSNREFTRGFSGSPAALREAVLSNLSEALTVTQGTGSELLYISVSAKQPDEAAAIANAIAAEYLKLNRQRISEPAVQRAQIYAQELRQLRKKTVDVQEQVSAFRQQHGMIDLAPNSGDEAEAALSNLERKLLSAENQQRDIQAQLHAKAWASAAPGSNSTSDLATTLATEEAQLAKMRETLGPRNPRLLELQSQITATKRSLSSGLSAQLADVKKLVGRYSVAVNEQRRLVLQRRRVQDKGTKLLLELQSAEAAYKHALDGYPEVQFAMSGDFTDVSLVSRAEPPVRPMKPNKIKYFLASCILSLGLAIGIPFARELFLDRRLRCRDDLERHFGIPVLAQFSPISGAK